MAAPAPALSRSVRLGALRRQQDTRTQALLGAGCLRAARKPSIRRPERTTNGSATWPDPCVPVGGHDVGACKLRIGGSLSTVAVAMRLAVWISGVGDVRRGGEAPDRAAS